MNKIKRVFLDTAPVIYYIQRNELYFNKVKEIFIAVRGAKIQLVSSDITTAEACVYPYRLGRLDWIRDFNSFIEDAPVEIIHTSDEIAHRTAQIRAQYPSFKTMDAIQIATALVGGCDGFLTNDKRLRQFGELPCLTIDDFTIDENK